MLTVDPESIDVGGIQSLIVGFMKLPNVTEYLDICGSADILYVTDNLGSSKWSAGNVEQFRKYGIIMTGGRRDASSSNLRGFSQIAQKPQISYINLHSPDGKNPLNILAHEIGHQKWRDFAGSSESMHKPEFYKMLKDAQSRLGLPWDGDLDGNGVDISQTPNPLGDHFFDSICKAKGKPPVAKSRQKG